MLGASRCPEPCSFLAVPRPQWWTPAGSSWWATTPPPSATSPSKEARWSSKLLLKLFHSFTEGDFLTERGETSRNWRKEKHVQSQSCWCQAIPKVLVQKHPKVLYKVWNALICAWFTKTFLIWSSYHTDDLPILRTDTLNTIPALLRFLFSALHWHWGKDSERGSEHIVDGKPYAMAMHLVHKNSKYPNLTSALQHADGLAVLEVHYVVSLLFRKSCWSWSGF